MMTCGGQPVDLGVFDIELEEFMHYQYLPVKMKHSNQLLLEKRIQSIQPLLNTIFNDLGEEFLYEHYIYVTARRGFATPENPINRPGWHSDGFLTHDINYIWWEGSGTRFADQEFHNIPEDHGKALFEFKEQIKEENIITYPEKSFLKLTPDIIHATPLIQEPGEMRSFFKISISKHKYNLKGNSHNYLIDYNWTMYSRDFARNHPTHSNADFIPDNE